MCKSLRVFHYNMRHCLIKGHQGQMPQALIKIKLCKTSRYNNAAFFVLRKTRTHPPPVRAMGHSICGTVFTVTCWKKLIGK